MSVESIEKVIRGWETGEITPEQVIGKILLWLLELYRRLLKLEAKRPGQKSARVASRLQRIVSQRPQFQVIPK
jgi:hypothetical protein